MTDETEESDANVQTLVILCAACEVAVIPVADSDPERWECPNCHVSDTREAVLEEAKAHATDVAQQGLDDAAKGIADKHKFLTFTPGASRNRTYRFVTRYKSAL